MCGIAGVVRRDGPIDGDPRALAAALGGALAHRGPDGDGVWLGSAGDVLLIHRRLAIIDPRPEAAQPMSTIDGRHVVVFNGEIYNYRELRRELEQRGERFATESDTEVLLRLVTLDGPAALARARGMFALACWDRRERSLLLARDRFGIKPLYVASTPRQLAFASEMRALSAGHLVEPRPSAAGVLGFLRWGSVPPPLTWQRDVEMLAPGTWSIWRQGGPVSRGVFAETRAVYASDHRARASATRFRAEVASAVRDSVRAHLIADVPVGVFLSGGIDSSALVSAAASIGAANLQTFTVCFDDESSEHMWAQAVASAFGTRHQTLRVDATDVAADLPHILRHLDQPTIDAVNSFYVSRAVASTGIKAVLSGTGGDELFGGYPSFRRLPRAMTAKRIAGPLLPWVAPLVAAALPDRLKSRWRHFAATDGSLAEAYRVQRGFLLPADIEGLAGPALRDPLVWRNASEQLDAVERETLNPVDRETPYAGVARLETRVYLAGQLLRDIDVMAMAHGLEVRVPFVDHELTRVLWPELGFHPALLDRKRLLWDTLDRKLPEAILNRPKQGFTLPFARWIQGGLEPFVTGGMRALAANGWIASDAPERVWSAWRAGAAHWSRPWGLAVLGHFLSQS